MGNAMETPGKLALTLAPGDQVRIGDDVVVTFVKHVSTGRSAIKLSVAAPRQVPVKRAQRERH